MSFASRYNRLRVSSLCPRVRRVVTNGCLGLNMQGNIGFNFGIFVLLGLTVLVPGCRRKQFDETPEGVVREFIVRMKHVQGDPQAARAAFDLLSKEAQTNLSDRARRASAATGKRMGPEQMIAPALFFVHFEPRHWNTRTAGNRARVELNGLKPSEFASVPCKEEEGHWKIDPHLPPLPPIERRKGAEDG
jgi:hypothetical protein